MVGVRLLAAATTVLAVVQMFCIGLALLRVPMTQALALGAAVGALAVAVVFATRFQAVGDASTSGPVHRDAAPVALRTGLWVATAGAFGWLVWLWCRLLWVAWHRAPVRWDSLWYHVPAIHEWVLRGYVFFYPLDPRLADAADQVHFAGWLNFPMGVELTGFFTYFLLGTDRLIDATNLWYWPLAIAALVVLAGRLGARGPAPWLAGGLLFAVAQFLGQSATAYVDPGFASTVMASLAAAVLVAFGGPGPLRWRLLLLGGTVGLAVGTKGPGLPYAAVILLLTLVAMGWREGIRRSAVVASRMAVVVAVMMAVGGYWSVRNAVHTGNPLYPVQLSIGQNVLAPGYDFSGYGQLDWVVPDNLRAYPAWSRGFVTWLQPDYRLMADDLDPFRIHHATQGGLGFFWPFAALPALLYLWAAAIIRHRSRVPVLAFLTVAAVLMYGLTTITWQARFVYWLYALGLPAFVVALDEGVHGWRRSVGHRAVVALCCVALGLAVWESSRVVEGEARVARAPESTEAAPEYRSPVDLNWPWMNESEGFEELMRADRIARSTWAMETGELFNGVLAMPLGKRTIRVLPGEPTRDDIQGLERDGSRWILWHARQGEALPAAVAEAAERTFVHRGSSTWYYAVDLGEGEAP